MSASKIVCKTCTGPVYMKGNSYFHDTGFTLTNTIAREVEPRRVYEKRITKATTQKKRGITIIELPTIL